VDEGKTTLAGEQATLERREQDGAARVVRPHEHVQDVPAGRVIEQLTRGEVPQHNIHLDAVQHELAVAETHLVDRAEQQIDVAAMHGLLDRDEDVLVFFQATGALQQCDHGFAARGHPVRGGPQRISEHSGGVDVRHMMVVGEVAEGRDVEEGAIDLGDIDAAQLTADVELQQPE
jgi:hypothetical protein